MSKIELKGLAHICLAVRDIKKALPFYQDLLNFKVCATEELTSQSVRIAMLEGGATPLELIEPLNESSPLNKFLNEKGEGVHHLAYFVSDLEATLILLEKEGVRLIDQKPRMGFHQQKIAFIHPSSGNGALIELVERA